MSRWNKRWWLAFGLVLVLATGGVGWLERAPLLNWYTIRGLSRAELGDRKVWVERVIALDGAALPGLVDLLNRDDAKTCGNAEAALVSLCNRWNADDARRQDLERRLADGFNRFSGVGQETALRVAITWVGTKGNTAPAQSTVRAEIRILEEASRTKGKEAHAAGLDLAAVLLDRTHDVELIKPCQDLALACFQDQDAENRAHAVRLALNPKLDLAKPASSLLGDPSPEVRRMAMLAVGSAKDAVTTDDLLHWLHDEDAEVRRLCELELRGRGLQDDQLRLGRLISDPSPKKRLEVFHFLRYSSGSELDPGVWIRHLSHDSAPEIRFAAIRAVKEEGLNDLNDRIDQMARNDPSPTVCEYARRFLSSQSKREENRP